MYQAKSRFVAHQSRKVACPACQGSGKVLHTGVFDWGWKPCGSCKGSGQVEVPVVPQQNLRKQF